MSIPIPSRTQRESEQRRLEPEEQERALRALDAMLEGEEDEQRETLKFLQEALDDDPPSHRRLFSF